MTGTLLLVVTGRLPLLSFLCLPRSCIEKVRIIVGNLGLLFQLHLGSSLCIKFMIGNNLHKRRTVTRHRVIYGDQHNMSMMKRYGYAFSENLGGHIYC